MKTKKITSDQSNDSIIITMIIELFLKEGYVITDKNIIFSKDFIPSIDVIVNGQDIKKNGSNILIYTKHVSNKKIIEKSENLKIFDINDLKELSSKYSNTELLDKIK